MQKLYIIEIIVVFLFVSLLGSFPVEAAIESTLAASSDGRYLVKKATGEPFFWMGDTGWKLMRISQQDVDLYMADRAAKAFNVIQAMVLHLEGSPPNAVPKENFYYELPFGYNPTFPFNSQNPLTTNEEYFEHIDYIVDKANENNLYIALVPVWGSMMDVIFDVNDSDAAYEYGFFLGERYASKENVIWIVNGEYHKIGDNHAPDSDQIALINKLAEGLVDGQSENSLLSIHPDGCASSSEHFHYEGWSDFNMIQTYKITSGTENIVYSDWQLQPAKPTINAEPGYEGRVDPQVTDVEARYEAYHGVFQGGFGHTYGAHPLWQFDSGWLDGLDLPAASQIKHLRALVESRPIAGRIPNLSIINSPVGNWTGLTRVRATSAEDGSYAMIYFPVDNVSKNIDVGEVSGSTANAWWYNCRDGKLYDSDNVETSLPFETYACDASQTESFDPPGNYGAGYDWVLILDDSSKGYDIPGGNKPFDPVFVFQQDSGPEGIISMEAEHCHDNVSNGGISWIEESSTDTSGGIALVVSPDLGENINTDYAANSPELTFNVNFVKTGDHYIWVRFLGPDDRGDSVHVGLDGAETASCDRISRSAPINVWHWTNITMDARAIATINVASTGEHTVNIWMREDGAKVDKLVITTDQSYTPSGYGPDESLCESGQSPYPGFDAHIEFSAPDSNAFQQENGSEGIISMEAEHCHDNVSNGGISWIEESSTDTSGGIALVVSPDLGENINTDYAANSPELTFNVNFVKTGDHYIWVRFLGPDDRGDSVHVGLDGAETASCDRISRSAPINVWHWTNITMDARAIATFNVVSTGEHTVNIWIREDGAKVDKVVITTSSSYDPLNHGYYGPPESSY